MASLTLASLRERMAPARLGTGFRWLLASGWTSSLADGIAVAAGPLLVASQTDQKFLVALAALLQWAPPMLFGLFAGVLTDRVDRRRVVITGNLLQVVALVLLTTAVATGVAVVGLVLAAMFVLGTAEVFVDSAEGTLVTMLVDRDDLAIANGRLFAGFITVHQLIGPPVGALLFAVGHAVPFGAQAVGLMLAVALIARMELPPHPRSADEVRPVRHDIADAVRWVLHHAAVRTLALTILIFNITYGAAWSVLVLYATQRLGLPSVGFGLVTTVIALGGIAGTFCYGWLTRRISLGGLMRIGLIIETLTHLVLALARSPYVAMPVFFVFGAHAFVWGTTSVTIRQRAVPGELQGRVNAVNSLGMYGGLVVGAAIGGAIAQRWGVTAPFWFAFVGSAAFVVLLWGQLTHIAHDDDDRVVA